MIKPKKLRKGDTIGIVATSFPFPEKNVGNSYYQEFLRAKELVRSLGFNIKLAEGIEEQSWWRAGTPQHRAIQINSMFEDSSVDAIMVHDGGQSAIGILEYLDYEMIRRNPKIFIGFSDITNILLAIYRKSNVVTFHGPLFTYGFGKHWHNFSKSTVSAGLDHFYNMLTKNEPLGKVTPITKWESYKEGYAKGKIIGGNLGAFPPLLGSGYTPKKQDFAGNILLWEIDNVESYRIEKGLYQLKHHGILDIISGMIIGKLPGIKPTAWPGLQRPSNNEIVLDVLNDYSFPILAEFDIGHETVDLMLPLGIEAEMNVGKEGTSLSLLESAVG